MNIKKQAPDWKKISVNHICDKELVLEYTNNFLNSIIKKTTSSSIGKLAKDMNRHFTESI